MYKPISYVLHSFLLLVLIGTIGSIAYTINMPAAAAPVDTPIPTPTAIPSYAGTFEAIPEAGWSTIGTGLERRVIQIYDDQNQPVETVNIWRIDQSNCRLDVAFDKHPKSLENWQTETDAVMVVNGGYFSITNEQYSADGLTILNGSATGKSFSGYGGMLAITDRGAQLRSLIQNPYDPNERLDAAMQAFPILVAPGGGPGFGSARDNQARARRTVIAQDRSGRILFIVTPQGYFTLHGLSVYLSNSDLDLDIALNLDGGGSTGILVDEPREVIPSKVLLPFVILVHKR